MLRQRTTRLLQSGFTLIELIIVIVIIGILAAVAIPQYSNLAAEARLAAMKGVGGAISSAAATNYALRAGGITAITPAPIAVATCTAAGGLIGTLPANITIDATGLTTAGVPGTCTLTHSGGGTHAFPVLGST